MSASADGVLVGTLAHDGRGVARVAGKATFIRGALPGERVAYRVRRRRRGMDEAELTAVLEPSPARVAPRCPHFGVCGGCALQHLAPAAQRAAKADSLLGDLRRIARLVPDRVLEPLAGPDWHYRRRARLGVHRDRATSTVRIGFRGEDSHTIQALTRCEVLDPRFTDLFGPLAALIASLSIPHRVPQVELAGGEDRAVLVFRHLEPLSAADEAAIAAFGRTHGIEPWLQPGGPASAAPLGGAGTELAYTLEGLRLAFLPTDFVQVNAVVNAALVARALDLLAPRTGERLLDLFAGLGNFTLPMAARGATVVGVEGETGLVARARANAERNGFGAHVTFHQADLFQPEPRAAWAQGGYAGVLLDPPRAGAREVLPLVAAARPARIVYVSCHPGTLARDAGLLVHEHGYRLAAAGIVDMFPHTAHVESLALFERGG